jgi:hypothetical protein
MVQVKVLCNRWHRLFWNICACVRDQQVTSIILKSVRVRDVQLWGPHHGGTPGLFQEVIAHYWARIFHCVYEFVYVHTICVCMYVGAHVYIMLTFAWFGRAKEVVFSHCMHALHARLYAYMFPAYLRTQLAQCAFHLPLCYSTIYIYIYICIYIYIYLYIYIYKCYDISSAHFNFLLVWHV